MKNKNPHLIKKFYVQWYAATFLLESIYVKSGCAVKEGFFNLAVSDVLIHSKVGIYNLNFF